MNIRPLTSPFSNQATGLIIFIVGISLAPIMDSIAKLLSGEINATQVAFVRFAIQALAITAFIAFTKTSAPLRPKNLAGSALLGIVLALSLVCYFSSLKWLPLANATAIFFVEPMCLTVMSHLFLGEKVGWRRYLAVFVGLIGALIIIRPSFIDVGWPSLLPVLAALLAATYMLMASRLTKSEHPVTMQLSAGLAGFAFLGAILLLGTAADYDGYIFIWPNTDQWLLLCLAGVVGTMVGILLTYAVKYARASFLAPFGYFEIVTAIILSAVLFKEIPDLLTWLGIFIIIASGLFILWREKVAHTH